MVGPSLPLLFGRYGLLLGLNEMGKLLGIECNLESSFRRKSNKLLYHHIDLSKSGIVGLDDVL